MSRIRLLPLFVLLFIPSLAVQNAQAANSAKNLPPVYKHWLEAEVPYIITSDERKEFLTLTTDAQRDGFIATFWRIRNPDPNSSVNSYRDEHYRRLAYVNQTFGVSGNEDGWRTDQGRMYIILGAPKQRAHYNDVGNIRPMEIWFYQADTPALPPFFYLLFYKPGTSEDFRLYSPRFDTPVKLCSTGETRNDPVRALKIIRDSLGEEVARTTITLLPNENANSKEFEPSMESDALLNKINDLADNPITKERLEQNRLRERVTTSIFLGSQEDTKLSYASFRDERGRMTLSYLLTMQYPDAKLVGKRADGTNYYDLTLRTEVMTTAGKLVYSQEDHMTGNLTAAQATAAAKKRFAAEARLPIAPGAFNLEAILTNNVNQVATRQKAMVTVPMPKSDGAAIPELLVYREPAAIPDPHDQLPFSGSHFRFTPRGSQNVYIRQGDKLPLVFQLWLDPRVTATNDHEKVHVHYLFGSITASHQEPTRDDEDVDAGNRDDAGNLLTGHTLDTSILDPGSYQVVVSANRENDQKTAYATLNLHVSPASEFVDTWTAYGPSDPAGEALDDLKRGMAAESQGADTDAQDAYVRALKEGPGDMRPFDRLAALLARKGMTDQLAALSQQPILAKAAANPSTLVLIAAALSKNGNPKGVVRMLEAQITLQPPSVELYTVLADACQASGNGGRAHELRELAANLKK